MSKNEIKIGATLSVDIQRVSNGNPIDLTNYEVTSELKHPKFGVFPLEVEITDAEEGRVRGVMEADRTKKMLPGEYIWDIKYVDPDGNTEIFPKNNSLTVTFIKGATR